MGNLHKTFQVVGLILFAFALILHPACRDFEPFFRFFLAVVCLIAAWLIEIRD